MRSIVTLIEQSSTREFNHSQAFAGYERYEVDSNLDANSKSNINSIRLFVINSLTMAVQLLRFTVQCEDVVAPGCCEYHSIHSRKANGELALFDGKSVIPSTQLLQEQKSFLSQIRL